MTPDFEKQLKEHMEKEAIKEVLYLYCRAIDRGDAKLLASVYHEDAEDFHGMYNGPISGLAKAAAAMVDKYEMSQHSITNIIIRLEGDVAYSESHLYAFHRRRTLKGELIDDFLRCRYADRLEKRNGAWRIARRKVIYDWGETRPALERTWWTDVPGDYAFGGKDTNDPAYTEGVIRPR